MGWKTVLLPSLSLCLIYICLLYHATIYHLSSPLISCFLWLLYKHLMASCASYTASYISLYIYNMNSSLAPSTWLMLQLLTQNPLSSHLLWPLQQLLSYGSLLPTAAFHFYCLQPSTPFSFLASHAIPSFLALFHFFVKFRWWVAAFCSRYRQEALSLSSKLNFLKHEDKGIMWACDVVL